MRGYSFQDHGDTPTGCELTVQTSAENNNQANVYCVANSTNNSYVTILAENASDNSTFDVVPTYFSFLQHKGEKSGQIRFSLDSTNEKFYISGASVAMKEEADIDTDDIPNVGYLNSNFVSLNSSTVHFTGMTMIENVAVPGTDYQVANKKYVDDRIIHVTHSITPLTVSANSTHADTVSCVLPSGFNTANYNYFVTVTGSNISTLLSVTRTEPVSSSGGAWLRVGYLAYNPTAEEVTGSATIHILCTHI